MDLLSRLGFISRPRLQGSQVAPHKGGRGSKLLQKGCACWRSCACLMFAPSRATLASRGAQRQEAAERKKDNRMSQFKFREEKKSTDSEEQAAKTAALEEEVAKAAAENAALRAEIRKKEARACSTLWWS